MDLFVDIMPQSGQLLEQANTQTYTAGALNGNTYTVVAGRGPVYGISLIVHNQDTADLEGITANFVSNGRQILIDVPIIQYHFANQNIPVFKTFIDEKAQVQLQIQNTGANDLIVSSLLYFVNPAGYAMNEQQMRRSATGL